MSIHERICQAFCVEVRVNPFENGFGISTPFSNTDGDLIGYYIVGPDASGMYKIVDNALTVAGFESEGATLDTDSRRKAFFEILDAHGAEYDEDDGELCIRNVSYSEIENKSLNFLALLLRMQDMYYLTYDRVKSTFYEDVQKRLESVEVEGLSVTSSTPVSEQLSDAIPDFTLRREGFPAPVALFLANSPEKLWQAMHLKLTAEHEAKLDIKVVALLETAKIGSEHSRNRAGNRLDALPNWMGDENAAFARVMREVGVTSLN